MAEEFPEDAIHDSSRRLAGEDETPPKQKAVLAHHGDTVAIDRRKSTGATVMGGEEVARLTMGGHGQEDDNNTPANIMVLSIRDKEDPTYQEQVALARKNGLETSDLVLLSKEENFTGIAFLKTGRAYSLGREGNIQWAPFGAYFVDKSWTPFARNTSVSKRQLTIIPTEDSVVAVSITDNSKTEVVAGAINHSSVPLSPAE